METARSTALLTVSTELVYGPSSLVGWAGLPAAAVPGNQVATPVEVLSRLLGSDPWQKTVSRHFDGL